jgi:hypothetical protein
MSKRVPVRRRRSDPVLDHPVGRNYALTSVFAMFSPDYRDQEGVLAVPMRVVEGQPPKLALLSPNEAALQRVKEILGTPGAEIEGFAIDPPPERDVQLWGRALATDRSCARLDGAHDKHAVSALPAAASSPPGFMLRIMDGDELIEEHGPFESVSDAWHAMQSMGEPGLVATICDGSHVAEYRGRPAVYSFRRTRWSRSGD